MASETPRSAVRVIKRGQRELQTQAPPGSPSAARAGHTDRDLAATVTSWVDEFRRQREVETASLLRLARLWA